jgi:pyruvate ferredoxin oxidoreductase gamma subunit
MCDHGQRSYGRGVTAGSEFEVRFHGRGGQGVVTAAELLSVAAFIEGRHAQAFPSFGSERTGAPVVAFCRIADRPIRTREPIARPDALVIQDPTLLHQVDLFGGLATDGFILVNTTRSFGRLGIDELAATFRPGRTLTVPAGELAREQTGKPLPNAALLGAFAALTSVVAIDSVEAAVQRRFAGALGAGNAAAARAAFDFVRAELPEVVRG